MGKTKTTKAAATDFLALAFGPGMSFHSRSPDREKAIRLCAREVRSTARSFGNRKRITFDVAVYDMSGAGVDDVWWDYRRQPFVGDEAPLGITPEFVTV